VNRRAALVAAAALLTTLVISCGRGGIHEGEARLTVDGTAMLERANGEREQVERSATLHRGDEVEVVDGAIVLELASGARIEGREAHGRADATRLRFAEPPEVLAGEVLLTATEAEDVMAAGTTVELTPNDDGIGIARISRTLAMGAEAYAGSVVLDSAGQRRTIPALRAMEVAALGRPPSDARPLQYDEDDAWDLRYLGRAIDLGRRLTAISVAYTGSLHPGEGRSVGFFRQVLPALEDEQDFTDTLVDRRRAPGETLIGAAITTLGERGSFTDRWRNVFSFRSEGAAWGLVALDQDVEGDPLLGGIEDALNASPLEFSAASLAAFGVDATLGAGGAGGLGGTGTGTTPGSDGGSGGGTLPPGGGSPPASGGGSGGTGTPLDDLIDTVEDVVDTLLDPPPPPPPPTTTTLTLPITTTTVTLPLTTTTVTLPLTTTSITLP
jgi:hypothetical protein